MYNLVTWSDWSMALRKVTARLVGGPSFRVTSIAHLDRWGILLGEMVPRNDLTTQVGKLHSGGGRGGGGGGGGGSIIDLTIVVLRLASRWRLVRTRGDYLEWTPVHRVQHTEMESPCEHKKERQREEPLLEFFFSIGDIFGYKSSNHTYN